ncbi:MAG TPA: class I SAM-dependent methyltransferase [Verrucomicrobiae bacterium]|nr:class I SAM-dependent methyltransferase [Verrucomicrobiae bacterium]
MEIGTWNGNHARMMIQEALKWHRPEEISYYGFDLFEDAEPDVLAREVGKSPPSVEEVRGKLKCFAGQGVHIHLYKGNSTVVLPPLVTSLPQMDFVLIDGGHSIPTIQSDWINTQKVMGAHTVVIFDDHYTDPPPHLDGAGCQSIVHGLDASAYEVKILKPMDQFEKQWGVMKISFVKVTRKSPRANPA